MAEQKARVFAFAVALDREGRASAEGATVRTPDSWKPEHLVLAGLLQCSLNSLRYHAARAGIEAVASGEASGTVTRREEDGRFAFIEIECRLDAELTPPPDDLQALLAKAERDCFVGASLTAKPHYTWNVT